MLVTGPLPRSWDKTWLTDLVDNYLRLSSLLASHMLAIHMRFSQAVHPMRQTRGHFQTSTANAMLLSFHALKGRWTGSY
jgi:hypothetical protein